MRVQLQRKTLDKVKALRDEQMAGLNNELAEVINRHSATLEPQDVLAVFGYLVRKMENSFDKSK